MFLVNKSRELWCDLQRTLQLEADGRLSWQSNVTIPGVRGSRCARTAADQRADGRPLTAACQRTDQGTSAGASANHNGGAFTLALLETYD